MAATNQQHQIDPSFPLILNTDAIEVGWKLCVPVSDCTCSACMIFAIRDA